MKNVPKTNVFFVAALCLCIVLGLSVIPLHAQKVPAAISRTNREVTILVTAMPDNDRTRAIADKLQPSDFEVRENKRMQKVISAKRGSEVAPVVAVLIQDDLVSRVNNELDGIREFIRGLPSGSRVMTGYIGSGSLQVRQDFTTDRAQAAGSLRILRSSDLVSPYSPYSGVLDALKRFDGQPAGRRMVLLVSDGLDTSGGFRWPSSIFSLELDRAITNAQRRGVAVFTMYSPAVGLTSVSRRAVNMGQSSLLRIADETGGEAFFSGTDFVTFDPYFREYRELLGRQWVITYRSDTAGSAFRRIEVLTDFDIHLHYPRGYDPR